VGANLDFDALVTECASLDALRQRFGRLNRLGLRSTAPAVIVVRRDQEEDSAEDPIYGSALHETWNWLNEQATNGEIELSIASVDRMLRTSDAARIETLRSPAPNAPVLLPAYLDCLVQTAPAPCPDPGVSVFLHGVDRGVADVQVLWRADLNPQEVDEDTWIAAVSLCPPTAAEAVSVPLHTVREWLAGSQHPSMC
jgi:CRISPR-associated endonuclease/helicase Cas3